MPKPNGELDKDTNAEDLTDEEELQDDADNEEDTSESDDTSEDDNDSATDEEDESLSDDDSESDDSDLDEDDEDDEEDDNIFEQPQTPQHGAVGNEDTPFDITKLPRNEKGLLDINATNKAINDEIERRVSTALSGQERMGSMQTKLEKSWTKVQANFPHIAKNKTLLREVKDRHLQSIVAARNGTGKYLSPEAAARRVSKIYKLAASSGAKSQRTKTRVVSSGQIKSGGGKQARVSAGLSEYNEAMKMSQSRDPAKAKEGRIKVMRIRRAKRNSRS